MRQTPFNPLSQRFCDQRLEENMRACGRLARDPSAPARSRCLGYGGALAWRGGGPEEARRCDVRRSRCRTGGTSPGAMRGGLSKGAFEVRTC